MIRMVFFSVIMIVRIMMRIIKIMLIFFNMMLIIRMLGNDQNGFLQRDDDCDDCQDEEKFQREILSDEPNLIKLYLQVDKYLRRYAEEST